MNDMIYLGGAVYAHFDVAVSGLLALLVGSVPIVGGYGVELKLNDHRNECAVYLEPEVLQALTEFYKRCSQPENN
jgi:hypothetical protein